MLPDPWSHVMCSINCDICTEEGENLSFYSFDVKFKHPHCLMACNRCIDQHGMKTLWNHVRAYNWNHLSAAGCICGVDLSVPVNVVRSSGRLEEGWKISQCGRTLVYDEFLKQVLVCVERGGYMKFFPLRLMYLHNPAWKTARLEWCNEPHMTPELRKRWKSLWTQCMFYIDRCLALMYTFGDDLGRLIAAY
jgi:hypothetical protein